MKKSAALLVALLTSTFLSGVPASAGEDAGGKQAQPRLSQPIVSCSPFIEYPPRHLCRSILFGEPPSIFGVDKVDANNAPETVVSVVQIDGDEIDDILTTPGESDPSRRDVAKVDRQLAAIAEDYEQCEGECAANIQVHIPKSPAVETTELQTRVIRDWPVTCELSGRTTAISSDESLSAVDAATLASNCVLAHIAEELRHDNRPLFGYVTFVADLEPTPSERSKDVEAMGDSALEDLLIEVLVQNLDSLVSPVERGPTWMDRTWMEWCESYDCRQGYCDPYCQ